MSAPWRCGSTVVGAAALIACALIGARDPLASEPPSPSSLLTASMSTVRWLHVAARLGDGRVLVAGGYPDAAFKTGEIYDPATGAWTLTGSMHNAHDWPVADTLCDGTFFVAGRNSTSEREAELYDPVANAWLAGGKMKISHIYGTATRLENCRVLLTGGFDANTQSEIYYPEGKIFKAVESVMSSERFFHTTTLLKDGRVLAAGGGVSINSKWSTYATVDIFDPATSLWTKAAPLLHARRSHTATLLPDGRVLVTGGTTGGKNDATEAGMQLATAELYDPVANRWTELPSLTTARAFHTTALMPNGAVLLFGGLDGSGSASRSVEGYFEGTWHALDPLLVDRYQHTSALLDDGRVLVMGGVHQATAELYRLAPNGLSCASNLACEGGHCVDGVCCNEACTTGCRRCNVPGSEGTCARPCADATHALGCSDGSATCANAACVAQTCGKLVCDAATASCRTKCASVVDCAPGYACDHEGACVPPPDVSSADPGACRAAAPDERWGAGLSVGAALAALAFARRRGRRANAG